MDQSTHSTNSLLVGLMILTIFVSLGSVAYMAQRQSVADRAQRELIMSMLQAQAPTPSQRQPVQTAPSMGVVAPGSAGSMMGATEPAPALTVPAGWQTAAHATLSVSYPAGWMATTFPDEFFGEQNNLRLTSARGELRTGGGPGMDGVTYFDEGYQIVISELDPRQNLGSTGPTPNPLVKRVYEGCADAGCPQEQYIIEKGEKRFLMAVAYYVRDEDQANTRSIMQGVIASIK